MPLIAAVTLFPVFLVFNLLQKKRKEPHDQKLDYIVTPSGVVAADFSDNV